MSSTIVLLLKVVGLTAFIAWLMHLYHIFDWIIFFWRRRARP